MTTRTTVLGISAALAACLATSGCTNSPYPDSDLGRKVLYSSFNEAPKTLDPAVAYTTAEHIIQTAFYERVKGVTPNCSIYYVGWNDLRNAHLANLDPGYADFHLPAQADVFRTRPVDLSADSISPLSILVGRYRREARTIPAHCGGCCDRGHVRRITPAPRQPCVQRRGRGCTLAQCPSWSTPTRRRP